jgi:hypothetical protein
VVYRLPRLRNDVILHQWRGCQVTYVDVVAIGRASMTSRSGSGKSGVTERVARRQLCKHSDYATMWAVFCLVLADGL